MVSVLPSFPILYSLLVAFLCRTSIFDFAPIMLPSSFTIFFSFPIPFQFLLPIFIAIIIIFRAIATIFATLPLFLLFPSSLPSLAGGLFAEAATPAMLGSTKWLERFRRRQLRWQAGRVAGSTQLWRMEVGQVTVGGWHCKFLSINQDLEQVEIFQMEAKPRDWEEGEGRWGRQRKEVGGRTCIYIERERCIRRKGLTTKTTNRKLISAKLTILYTPAMHRKNNKYHRERRKQEQMG